MIIKNERWSLSGQPSSLFAVAYFLSSVLAHTKGTMEIGPPENGASRIDGFDCRSCCHAKPKTTKLRASPTWPVAFCPLPFPHSFMTSFSAPPSRVLLELTLPVRRDFLRNNVTRAEMNTARENRHREAALKEEREYCPFLRPVHKEYRWELELPGDGSIGRGCVRAEHAGLDGRRQIVFQERTVFSNLCQGSLDAFDDVNPRPLGRRYSVTRATPESEPAGEFCGEEARFLLHFRCPSEVMKRACFYQFFP